jgi:hypothetical protein
MRQPLDRGERVRRARHQRIPRLHLPASRCAAAEPLVEQRPKLRQPRLANRRIKRRAHPRILRRDFCKILQRGLQNGVLRIPEKIVEADKFLIGRRNCLDLRIVERHCPACSGVISGRGGVAGHIREPIKLAARLQAARV